MTFLHRLPSLFALALCSGVLACDGGGGGDEGEGDAGEGEGETGEGEGEGEGGEGEGEVPLLPATADLDEAFFVCAWAETCLDPEIRGVHDGAQPAPAPTMSLCLQAYLLAAVRGVSALGVDPVPFDGLGGCAHIADDCADYQQCLFDIGLLNFCPDETQPGTACDGDVLRLPCAVAEGSSRAVDCAASGLRCEDGACKGDPCTALQGTCSEDASFTQACVAGSPFNLNCHGDTCALLDDGRGNTQGRCLPPTIGTCATSGNSCDGDVQVACLAPVESRVDCAAIGMGCDNGSCSNVQNVCDEFHADVCVDDALKVCIAGAEHAFACAAVGGTCGQLSNGEAGCVF